MASDYPAAFSALRAILKRNGRGLVVHADTPTDFTLITPAIGPNKKPIWFGAVLLKKSAVTYHFLPLYYNPKLQATIPPELLPRKQGKACFNFQRPDAALFAQLDALTARGREHYERHGLLIPGPVPAERFAEMLRASGEDPEAIAKIRIAKGQQAAAKRAATKKKLGAAKKKKSSRR